jgi:hypothetical protein
MVCTSGLISSYYIESSRRTGLTGRGAVGQWVAGECGSVGRRGKGTVGPKPRHRSRSAGHGSRGGVDSPSDRSTTGCVRGHEGKEEREGCEEVPAHVAQTGTLTSQGGFERRGRSTLHRRARP